jgi:23S rRNA (pseudouridine1915-N3)-methyltransferase
VLHIKLISQGKSKEKWLQEACSEYEKRLLGRVNFSFIWAKDSPQLEKYCLLNPKAIALDPQGQLFDSIKFSNFLFQQFEQLGSHLTLIIGGAEGLSKSMVDKKKLISLSPMTFTHQMSRLILMEQIYRACEIQQGSRYHK